MHVSVVGPLTAVSVTHASLCGKSRNTKRNQINLAAQSKLNSFSLHTFRKDHDRKFTATLQTNVSSQDAVAITVSSTNYHFCCFLEDIYRDSNRFPLSDIIQHLHMFRAHKVAAHC